MTSTPSVRALRAEEPSERRPQAQSEAAIENLLAESRTFPPDPAFSAQANAKRRAVRRGRARLRGVLGEAGSRAAHLVEPFTKTLEWDLPFAKWFGGGELNLT